METQEKSNFNYASVGLGLLIFIFTFLISVNFLLFVENLLTVKNETTAVQTIGAIRICQSSYAGEHQGEFAPTFAELVKIGCLDSDEFVNVQPGINGYIFTMKVEEPSKTKPAFYSINADPQIPGGFNSTGTRRFYYDSTLGTLKVTDENRQATNADPLL